MTLRRYLVTGASSGVGAAVARALLALDPENHVVAMGRNLERLEALQGRGPDALRVRAWACDFGRPGAVFGDVTACFSAAAVNGSFDGVFHAAGVETVAPLRTPRAREVYRSAMMAADSAYELLCACASPSIHGISVLNDGASVVLMSSVAAHRGVPGMAAYSAGKAAIEGMVRPAALEFAPRRIRVNAIAPGAFHSPMHDRITSRLPEQAQEAYARAHALGVGQLHDVAAAVLFLLGPDSRWITGTVQVVDGGYSAK